MYSQDELERKAKNNKREGVAIKYFQFNHIDNISTFDRELNEGFMRMMATNRIVRCLTEDGIRFRVSIVICT